MNTLKIKVLIIAALFILAGCSDQITSLPDNAESNTAGLSMQKNTPDEVDQVSTNYFSTRIKIGSNQEYSLNWVSTGLAKFTAIDIDRIVNDISFDKAEKDCKYLSVNGEGSKIDIALSCHSKGFDVKRITLKNLTSKTIEINVSLLGVKATKNPKAEQ